MFNEEKLEHNKYASNCADEPTLDKIKPINCVLSVIYKYVNLFPSGSSYVIQCN